MYLMAIFVFLCILFVVRDGSDAIREWWNREAIVEEEVDDSLAVDGIGSQSPAKEAQVRRLNERMSEFLNTYDIE